MYIKGEPVARRAVEVLSQLPADHHLNIRMAERLATICLANNNSAEAETLLKNALGSAERLWGADDPNIVSNLVGLATTYMYKGDMSSAEKYFKRSLSVMEKMSQIDSVQEYSMVRNLGICYLFQLKLDDALRLAPQHYRASHTSNFSSTMDLIRKLVLYAGKQINDYKKDRGEF
jgi:tetratricopeptide (TPR) repeat protein